MMTSSSTKTINVARDFSRFPAGRTAEDGPFSGEIFRTNHLLPAINEADHVIVNLDGARGYGSSFLDEAFGGLVRSSAVTKERLLRTVEIVSKDEPALIELIKTYIQNAN